MQINRVRGFTILELIIVVAIVALLSILIFTIVDDARAKSRDIQRVSDLSQVQIAIRLYEDTNDAYIAAPTGQVLGSGGSVDADLAPYMPAIPTDPTNDTAYYYQYDLDANCTASGQRVLFAKIAETDVVKNYTDTCTCTSGCDFDGGTPTEGDVLLLR